MVCHRKKKQTNKFGVKGNDVVVKFQVYWFKITICIGILGIITGI